MSFIERVDELVPNPSAWWRRADRHHGDAVVSRDGGASLATVLDFLERALREALEALLAQQGRLCDVDKRDGLPQLASAAGVEDMLPEGLHKLELPLSELTGCSSEEAAVVDDAWRLYESLAALRSDALQPGAPSGREQAQAASRCAAERKQEALNMLSAQERERQHALEEEGLAAARRFAPIALALFPGAEVYLFGSRVKGYASEGSDIDVAVILPCEDDGCQEKQFELAMAACDIDPGLEPIVRRFDDSMGFVRNVLLTGIRVA